MTTLRPFQARAVGMLLASKRAIIQAPAGSGKTIIGAAALSNWALTQFAPRVVWLANTREQIDQAKAACGLFPSIFSDCEITFACYAAGVQCAGSDMVVCDECHHVAAPEIRKSLEGCQGTIWGLSATPNRADDLKQDVFDLIGPILCVIDRNELIDAGNLAAAKVVFHQPNQPEEDTLLVRNVARPLIKEMFRKMRFLAYRNARGSKERLKEEQHKVISEVKRRVVWQCASKVGLYSNAKRDELVVALALEHSIDSVLVIVGSIEHGEGLQARIPGAVLVHSKIGIKRRREAMERFKSGDLRCMLATSLADEGLDVPRANVLILAAAGRSAAKAEQRTGRVLRAFAGKTHGIIHDFWDCQHYFLLAQSKARRRTYQNLGYTITFSK